MLHRGKEILEPMRLVPGVGLFGDNEKTFSTAHRELVFARTVSAEAARLEELVTVTPAGWSRAARPLSYYHHLAEFTELCRMELGLSKEAAADALRPRLEAPDTQAIPGLGTVGINGVGVATVSEADRQPGPGYYDSPFGEFTPGGELNHSTDL
jgi:hypothetical protein